MTLELERLTLGDWIQTGAVLAAVGASIVALIISWRDCVSARRIAAEDRTAALRQAKLMFDLEALLRLLENQNRGGSADDLERRRLGAEAMALVGLIGPERLPRRWDRRIGHSDEALHEKLTNDKATTPEFLKGAIEVQLALNGVAEAIRREMLRT